MKSFDHLNVAIVHDYLNQYGGAERCLEALHELFPHAPIYTLMYDQQALPHYAGWDIRPSWAQWLPGMFQHYKYYLWLFPLVVRTMHIRPVDVIISISHAWVKGVRGNGAVRVDYCLTPVRYAWDLRQDYLMREYVHPVIRQLLPPWLNWLRIWDRACVRHIDHLIAISETVKERIAAYYARPASVIWPPVDTAFFTPAPSGKREPFFLTVSRLKAYKRIDLIVEAFRQNGYPLKVVGNGPEYARLARAAGPNIEFVTNASDEEVRALYRRARAFVFAGVEDFGIVMAEASSTGLPVIAYGRGGATEIVEDGVNGILFSEQTVAALNQAIQRFETMTFVPETVRARALRYDRERFKRAFREEIIKIAEASCSAS